jgi:SAM-dependent methyltransferase
MQPELAHTRGNIAKLAAADPVADKLKQQLKTFWNNQQCYWDSVSSEEFVDSAVRQRMASFLLAGEWVLDIACGTAANSEWIKERCRYFGVDLSIKALQRPIHPSLMLACGDADDLPFRKECFDAVIATYVLEHAVEPVVTLQEMCRVVKPHGKIILLGPAWDFPFWYPNSLRSKNAERGWRLRYTLGRLWRQLIGCSFGKLPFARVDEPDAFRSEFVYDADAVYIVWTYEVIRLMKKWGHNLAHWEVDDPLLGANPVIRKFKNVLRCFPIYRYAGSTILLVFEK